jgi:PhoH-like ATPase
MSAHSESSPESAPRTFIVDTNVLLYDPGALYVFAEHDVVIPMTVIEEVDRFKKDLNETGRNARTVSRFLDSLREKGSLREGVRLPGGGLLRVDFATHGPDLPITWGPDTNDNRILRTVLRMSRDLKGNVAFITRDTNMRLKCDALGVTAEDYQNARIDVDEQYTGLTTREVPAAMVDQLYQAGGVALEELEAPETLYPQQFVMLTALENPAQAAMARVDLKKGRLKLVGRHKEGVWGVFARNKEQLFALELLLDDSISLVTLNGMAGTGKTLLALAAGLKKTTDERLFRRLLVSRPIFPLGRDMGFLPGDVEQKLNPWMKPIFDNLEYIISANAERGIQTTNGNRRGEAEPAYQTLIDQKLLEVEPLTYIRGRSIPNQYLIVDEAQNLTPHEVKTVLTRAGDGTKVVLTGDPNQIDNPYVDAMSNGLTYTVERFKSSPIAGHVTLRKGERSQLAELAAQLL